MSATIGAPPPALARPWSSSSVRPLTSPTTAQPTSPPPPGSTPTHLSWVTKITASSARLSSLSIHPIISTSCVCASGVWDGMGCAEVRH